MRIKIFKPLVLLVLAAAVTGAAAQNAVVLSTGPAALPVKTGTGTTACAAYPAGNIQVNLTDINKTLLVMLNNMTPDVEVSINKPETRFNFIYTNDANNKYNIGGHTGNKTPAISGSLVKDKFKSYSKSYPVNGNDRIRLSNQYGKITINTWDRHEVKVDVQVKAEAQSDDDAQKLLDGVHITDSKAGDQVSFRTEITHSSAGSWKFFDWGGSKAHKLTINYTVYMPGKTDLNVEDSYGSIVLPDLDGKVRITSSYGSVSAQNLSNPGNQIEGSYGNLKAGTVNGCNLNYAYGNVDMDECTTLKANLSYGSFKLSRLKGTADFDLSYVGGFKIDELANAFKRLNINASYSGVSLGLPDNNNFGFDITTTYGGFNYNDDKVTMTSKPAADGRHISSTKNYKGHFGKGAAGSQINIHTTYGGVNFE